MRLASIARTTTRPTCNTWAAMLRFPMVTDMSQIEVGIAARDVTISGVGFVATSTPTPE